MIEALWAIVYRLSSLDKLKLDSFQCPSQINFIRPEDDIWIKRSTKAPPHKMGQTSYYYFKYLSNVKFQANCSKVSCWVYYTLLLTLFYLLNSMHIIIWPLFHLLISFQALVDALIYLKVLDAQHLRQGQLKSKFFKLLAQLVCPALGFLMEWLQLMNFQGFTLAIQEAMTHQKD